MNPDLPVLQRVTEYDGGPVAAIAPTQQELPARESARVLDEWVEFFGAGPTPIAELEVRTRTPGRLLDALASQTQLRRLEVKWGDYADLSALAGLTELGELMIGPGVAVTSLEPLRACRALRRLVLSGLRDTTDYSPIADLTSLRELLVVDSLNGPRLHARSVGFLAHLHHLESLRWTPVVDDGDYSPFLTQAHVEEIAIAAARRMTPTIGQLEDALPALARDRRAAAEAIRRLRER